MKGYSDYHGYAHRLVFDARRQAFVTVRVAEERVMDAEPEQRPTCQVLPQAALPPLRSLRPVLEREPWRAMISAAVRITGLRLRAGRLRSAKR